MDHYVYGKELKDPNVNAGKWYGVKNILFIMGAVHVVRFSFALLLHCISIAGSGHRLYVVELYSKGREYIDIESVDWKR